MNMVSYAELCQAIERWQRSQGRVTALESALQQAMWRGFIQHHAPDVHMDFQGDPLDQQITEQDEHVIDDFAQVQESYQEEPVPYAATGS